ncbi:MAG TPA: hypothetical protein VI685_27965 [Candidatus Angelobacter sp.]
MKSKRKPSAGHRITPKSKKRRIRKRSSSTSNKPSPGEFALRERTLPHRRFVEFPLVKGKIAERVQLFTTTDSNSLAIEFQDQTSLVLNIEPGITIHAQLMRLEKGELETLAEWPPIKSMSER